MAKSYSKRFIKKWGLAPADDYHWGRGYDNCINRFTTTPPKRYYDKDEDTRSFMWGVGSFVSGFISFQHLVATFVIPQPLCLIGFTIFGAGCLYCWGKHLSIEEMVAKRFLKRREAAGLTNSY